MPRPTPVWGFPPGYDPNAFSDRCEACGASQWLERKLPFHPIWGDLGAAWTCAACTLRPEPEQLVIPD